MKAKRFLRFVNFLKFMRMILINGLLLLIPFFSQGQNVGIGVDNPTEKLQVAGKVFSSEQGFMFPDGSVQTRAYNAYETQDAGDVRWIIIMDLHTPLIPGSFSFGPHVNQVKVLDYQWGMTMVPGYGGTSGQLTVKTLKIIKNIDASTNPLLQKALDGAYFVDIRLFFFKQMDGQEMVEYYWIYLNDLIITAFDQKMVYLGAGQFTHLDFIEFEFSQATWHYQEGQSGNEANYTAPE
jgi:type VI secretion system Hcp family effector